MEAVRNLIFRTRLSITSFLLLLFFIISCTKNPEEEVTPEVIEKLELMNLIIGEYEVEGRYGGETLEPQTISVSKASDLELKVSGTGFPEFRIFNWYKSYNNPKDPDEFTISAESVGPNDGEISFSFPEKEIGVGVRIKDDDGSKRLLVLTGEKK